MESGKIVFTIVAIILLNLLPLAARPSLLIHYKTILLVIAAASLWLSQPAFSKQDTESNKSSDKFSILVILIMSSASVVVSVVEWAYFTNVDQPINAFSILGLAMLLCGIAVRVWSIRTLGKHFTATATITDDHQLIKDGPYKVVRHPSYLGAFMAIIGTPLFLNDKWAVLFVFVAMSVAYYIRISVEEKMLAGYFGKSYEHYKLSTKRIIPYIW